MIRALAKAMMLGMVLGLSSPLISPSLKLLLTLAKETPERPGRLMPFWLPVWLIFFRTRVRVVGVSSDLGVLAAELGKGRSANVHLKEIALSVLRNEAIQVQVGDQEGDMQDFLRAFTIVKRRCPYVSRLRKNPCHYGEFV